MEDCDWGVYTEVLGWCSGVCTDLVVLQYDGGWVTQWCES